MVPQIPVRLVEVSVAVTASRKSIDAVAPSLRLRPAVTSTVVMAVVRQGSRTVTSKVIEGDQLPSLCVTAFLRVTLYTLCFVLSLLETIIFSPVDVIGAPLGIVHVKFSVTVLPQRGVCGYSIVDKSIVSAVS